MMRTNSRAACLGLALMSMVLTNCTTHSLPIHGPSSYLAKGERPANAPPGPLVGLALSGGGNRSALFASYVIELLGVLPVSPQTGTQPVSFLSKLGYISSVSGGSFAAAYFGMRNPSASPSDFNAMLSPQGIPKAYASFFSDYHVMMNHDWFHAALVRSYLSTLGSWRSQWLVNGLDEAFLDKATFGQLDKRQSLGRSPYLIFNTTHYDTGRRFVMTTIAQPYFCINVEALLTNVLSSSLPVAKQIGVQKAQSNDCDMTDPLTPEGFDRIDNKNSFQIASADIPLSYAVVMSAAFPVVVGPVAYHVEGQERLFHVIDGGITDNSGVESLAQLFLNKLKQNEDQHALIVELDAGMPFNNEGTAIKDASTPLSTLVGDPSRLSDIQEQRATLYRRDLWHLANELARCQTSSDNADMTDCPNPGGEIPSASLLVSRLKILPLRHYDLGVDSLRVDVDHDPVAHDIPCHREWNTPETVKSAVRNLRTDFYLKESCDVPLARIAACWAVKQNAPKIQAWFARRSGKSAPELDGFNDRVDQLCPELKGKWTQFNKTPTLNSSWE
ncbi:patatin-like phospholipase family protein [Pseudomonas moorei]|uniref:patatin-like phospholipase family protein n=1 Tax=Pseudomonas moorei TaxID=395599 RepID=UPI001FF31280|nr:patatin-like phospholipase family protein [Pseudomonas moorei]